MTSLFHYRRVGQELIDELVVYIQRGESILLIGPRYVGKRYLLRRLKEKIGEAGNGTLLDLKFGSDDEVQTESQFWGLLADRLTQTTEKTWDATRLAADLSGETQRYLTRNPSFLFIAAANVDALPDHLARQLLRALRTLVSHPDSDTGKVQVLLTAESDPNELVHGENSEFNCNIRIVLQGFEEGEFGRFGEKYARALGMGAVPLRGLFELTGGNIYLLRALLWDLAETRSKEGRSLSEPYHETDLEAPWKEARAFWTWKSFLLRHTVQEIDDRLDCIKALMELLGESPVQVRGNAPEPLELAGVATRGEDGFLHFASPLVRSFARTHYSNRRLGHLMSRHQEWEEAFRLFQQGERSANVATAASVDAVELQTTLHSIETGLYAMALKGPDAVRRLFADSARFVLGFPTVTFWQFHGEWVPVDSMLTEGTEERDISLYRSLLPSAEHTPAGKVHVGCVTSRWAIWAGLPSDRVEGLDAVVLGDARTRHPIAKDRVRKTQELLKHFIQSLSQACQIHRKRSRLEVREKHIDIVENIVDALGKGLHNPKDVLTTAASQLRKLGYRRVAFSLVNPERTRIRGVVDDNDEGVDTAEMTDFQLGEPFADLECEAFATKTPARVADAEKHPSTCKGIVDRAQIKGMALVPMIRHGEVIGNMHVERNDKRMPTEEETQDLVLFAKQLASAIAQCEKEHLLESALDHIRHPLLILDREKCVRYANEPATAFASGRAGWREQTSRDVDASGFGDEALFCYDEAIRKNTRLMRRALNFGGVEGNRVLLSSAPIHNWRGEAIGGVLLARDINYLHGLFEAYILCGKARDTDSLLDALLEGTKALGHKWGRLYLISGKDPDCLIGHAQYGLSGEDALRFESGEVRLPRSSDPRSESWLCIDKVTPQVFSWDSKRPHNDEYTTSLGLRVINVIEPQCPVEVKKDKGDWWIDFPLISGARDQAMGKITLHCERTFDPSNFDVLLVFSEVASALIDSFLQREKLENKVEWVEQAADQAIGQTAHNIAGRLAALPLLLARYRRIEKDSQELGALNSDFDGVLTRLQSQIDRMKKMLRSVEIAPQSVDLSAFTQMILSQAVPEERLSVILPEGALICEVDPQYLEDVYLELVQNSCNAVADEATLRIGVEVVLFEHNGRPWVRILYRDNGPGIPHSVKKSIFRTFFSAAYKRQGTGLGLAFIHRVIEGHGGSIRECGTPGRGAEFVLEIPIVAA